MPTSSIIEYVPPPQEIEDMMQELRKKWIISPEAILAHRNRIQKQMSNVKGFSYPKDIYGVDSNKMSKEFEHTRSVVKDD
jgi:hypothetical protein